MAWRAVSAAVQQPWREAPAAPACVLVIFGAGGDLTHRLLAPALVNLADAQLLDPGFRVLGFGHRNIDEERFRSDLLDSQWTSGLSPSARTWLRERVSYMAGDFEDPAAFQRLAARLPMQPGNVTFYFATAPRYFAPLAEALDRVHLLEEHSGAFRRVVVEKPFGQDLDSSKVLNQRLLAVLAEHQIFRIDHYLGKETVQNIMALRFANTIYEPVWNRQHIRRVEITASETVGVEGRGRFYDATGALRDMVPNHMFQLLAMIAMEAPNALNADAIRAESARVLQAVRRYAPQDVAKNAVRGQYESYRSEPHISPTSHTETFVALRLCIDNWRWAGVPFLIRTGKAMPKACTHVSVHFDPVPHTLFPSDGPPPHGNVLVIGIKPVEGLSLHIAAKHPGPKLTLAPVRMDFEYADYFQARPESGYETLIYDCLVGDQMLFRRADHIEAAWSAVQPFLDAWRDDPAVELYPAGSWGPDAAHRLLDDSAGWRNEA